MAIMARTTIMMMPRVEILTEEQVESLLVFELHTKSLQHELAQSLLTSQPSPSHKSPVIPS